MYQFFVVGLGSMGRRRLRCLAALGFDCKKITVTDVNPLRVDAAMAEMGCLGVSVNVFVQNLKSSDSPILIVSTSPEAHLEYIECAVKLGIPCFVEASVTGVNRLKELAVLAATSGALVVPSMTMYFFPAIKRVREIIYSGICGKPLIINYQTGQYLKDWHPYEDIMDYYVSNLETGGCKEIVSFELTWLQTLFGQFRPLSCYRTKLSSLEAQIPDVHIVTGLLGETPLVLTIEVLSRPVSTRELRIVCENGIIKSSADTNSVSFIATAGHNDEAHWNYTELEAGTRVNSINPDEPYIDEISAFLDVVKAQDLSQFPHSIESDIRTLETLVKLGELAER